MCVTLARDIQIGKAMQTTKIVYREEDGVWLGYLQEFPDYWTQGDTLNDLEDHLRDLHADLAAAGCASASGGTARCAPR